MASFTSTSVKDDSSSVLALGSVGMNLLPKPQSVTEADGSLTLDGDPGISGPPGWAAIVRRLLAPGTGWDLVPAESARLVIIEDADLPAEGYRLEVGDTIAIRAADDRGVNWATQTLRQLMGPSTLRPAPSTDTWTLPRLVIEDAPRFGWRGVMLDVCRHFFPLADLFDFVDLLAMHKYNVLHLHLSDDQGWRFESRRHPELNATSTWRRESKNPHWESGDGTPHGGYYTQDQLRSLVRHAGQRGITVVPEIEFPGHVEAFLAAFPKLGQHPDIEPATTWGVMPRVLDMSDEAIAVAFDLFEELLDVFPSEFVHVGGDECPRDEWRASERARSLAAERGLPDVDHLQRWFTEKLRDFLAERGRRLVGWDEICDEGPLEGAVAMAWRNATHGVRAAEGGMDVVMSPSPSTYFDYYPSDDTDEPYRIGGLITTRDAYSFEPLAGLTEAATSRVLGTQCQLWTEYVVSMADVQYMLFPRACAHSEVAWSDPTDRSWTEFATRLAGHVTRLDALGVNHRPEVGPLPWQRGGTGARQRPAAHRH